MIENAEQGVFNAPVRVRVQFEIAPCRRIERDGFGGIFHRESRQMRNMRFLRLFDVGEQASRGGDAERHALAAESGKIFRAEESA